MSSVDIRIDSEVSLANLSSMLPNSFKSSRAAEFIKLTSYFGADSSCIAALSFLSTKLCFEPASVDWETSGNLNRDYCLGLVFRQPVKFIMWSLTETGVVGIDSDTKSLSFF